MDRKNEIALLEAAKERLFTTGWRKNRYGDEKGPNCIMGAISEESLIIGCTPYTIYSMLTSLTGRYGLVTMFNDAPETTFGDIIDLIDKAIKVFEMEECP